jgi:hypothetical protein
MEESAKSRTPFGKHWRPTLMRLGTSLGLAYRTYILGIFGCCECDIAGNFKNLWIFDGHWRLRLSLTDRLLCNIGSQTEQEMMRYARVSERMKFVARSGHSRNTGNFQSWPPLAASSTTTIATLYLIDSNDTSRTSLRMNLLKTEVKASLKNVVNKVKMLYSTIDYVRQPYFFPSLLSFPVTLY